MDTLEEKEMAQNMLNGEFFDDGDVTAVANDYLRLRAENESLKVDAVNWGAWRERVAAEFFQSDRFGMNDIWIAISALIRQRDEAEGIIEEQLSGLNAAAEAHAELERQRDEALKHYHAAIELADVQKYATLLDERDALVMRLEVLEPAYTSCVAQNAAMREALKPFAFENPGAMGGARVEVHVTAADTRRALAALNPDPAPEAIIPPSC